MNFKKETILFVVCLVLIFVVAYVNIVVLNKDKNLEEAFDENALAERQKEFMTDYLENENGEQLTDLLPDEYKEQLDETGNTIVDLTDVAQANASENIDISFQNFKINKAKANLDIVDHLEENLTNEALSDEVKIKFEEMLVEKNKNIQIENNIEIALQAKGYKDMVSIIGNENAKIITNIDLEKSDVTKILDVVMSETKFSATQIKIVKYNNN